MNKPPEDWRRPTAFFLVSQILSAFGSSVVSFSILWYLTIEASSGSLMTILILCTFVPQLLISPLAGVWADRFSRKRLILLSDLFVALATLLLALCYLAGFESLWLLFSVSAIRSLGSGIQMPAVSAILPQMVPQQQLVRINAINSSATSAMMLISPAVGGALLGTAGFVWAMMVDVATALCAVTILLFVRVRPYESQGMRTGKALEELKTGFSFAKNHPLIRRLLVFYALFFVLVSPSAFLTPLMVERSFGPEVWKLTANEISWTVGSLIGGLVVSVWGGPKNRLVAMAVAALGFGATITVMGVAKNFMFYLAAMTVSGMFLPLFTAADSALLQETVDESMMGRVFSVVQIIASAAMPLGMLAFGPLADVISVEHILIMTGAVMAALALLIFADKDFLELGKRSS